MLYQILSLVLDAAAGLVGGACLLRLYMQRLRVPFGNPVGRFVFALSDWLVVNHSIQKTTRQKKFKLRSCCTLLTKRKTLSGILRH